MIGKADKEKQKFLPALVTLKANNSKQGSHPISNFPRLRILPSTMKALCGRNPM
jgi:hypothetical protein